jgi:O-antigen/teichoic acid export membrane protein
MERPHKTETVAPVQFLSSLNKSHFGETIRQSGILFSAQTVSMLMNFLVALALLHWMERDEMGRLAFCLSVILLTNLFFELGIFVAGARVLALARDKQDERRALGALAILAAGLGAALGLFLIAVAAPIDLFFRIDVRGVLMSAAVLTLFQPFQLMIELSCQGLNRIRLLAVFQLLLTGTYLLALVALGLSHHLSAKSALLAYLSSTGLASLVTLAQLRPEFHNASFYIRQTIKEARSYGLNLYLARITGTASLRLDSFVIKYFTSGSGPLGLYDRAQKLANPISSLSRALAITRFRAFANISRVPARIVRWNTVILLGSSVLMASAGPFLVTHFFPNYADAAPLLVPFAFYNLFAGLFQPYNAFLAARGHSAALRNIAISITIASVAGLLIAVPLFGISGAAWAGAATMLLDYLLHLYYYRKLSGESGESFVGSL